MAIPFWVSSGMWPAPPRDAHVLFSTYLTKLESPQSVPVKCQAMFHLCSLTLKTSEDVQLVHNNISARSSFIVRGCPVCYRTFGVHDPPVTLTNSYFQMLHKDGRGVPSQSHLSGPNVPFPPVLPLFSWVSTVSRTWYLLFVAVRITWDILTMQRAYSFHPVGALEVQGPFCTCACLVCDFDLTVTPSSGRNSLS